MTDEDKQLNFKIAVKTGARRREGEDRELRLKRRQGYKSHRREVALIIGRLPEKSSVSENPDSGVSIGYCHRLRNHNT